jgi:hypothetical protein
MRYKRRSPIWRKLFWYRANFREWLRAALERVNPSLGSGVSAWDAGPPAQGCNVPNSLGQMVEVLLSRVPWRGCVVNIFNPGHSIRREIHQYFLLVLLIVVKSRASEQMACASLPPNRASKKTTIIKKTSIKMASWMTRNPWECVPAPAPQSSVLTLYRRVFVLWSLHLEGVLVSTFKPIHFWYLRSRSDEGKIIRKLNWIFVSSSSSVGWWWIYCLWIYLVC